MEDDGILPSQAAAAQSQQAQSSIGNYKTNEDDGVLPSQASIPQPQEQDFMQTMQDHLDVFNRQFDRMAANAIGFGAKALSYISGGDGSTPTVDKYQAAKDVLEQEALQRTPSAYASKIAGNVGAGIAYGAPALLLPGGLEPMVNRNLATIGSAVAGNAATGYAIDKLQGGDGVMGAALGALSVPTTAFVRGVSQALPGADVGPSGYLTKIFNPKKAAMLDLQENLRAGVQGTTKGTEALARMQNAEDTGGFLTPAEAVGAPISPNKSQSSLANLESKLEPSGPVRVATEIKTNARGQNYLDRVGKIIDDITPEGLNQAKIAQDVIRNNMKKVEIPTVEAPDGLGGTIKSSPILNKLKQNPYIAEAFDDMTNNTKSSFGKLPDTNLSKIDMVKRNLDDKLWNNTIGIRDGAKLQVDPSVAHDIRNALGELKTAFDNVQVADGVTYADARKLSQKIQFQKNVAETLEKTTGSNPLQKYYKAFMSNDEKVNTFLHYVDESGGDVENAKKIVSVLDSITQGKIEKNTAIESAGGTSLSSILGKLTEPRGYRDALTELITDQKQWGPLLKNVVDAPKTQQAEELAKSLQVVQSSWKNTGKGLLKTGGKAFIQRNSGIIPVYLGIDMLEGDRKR